MACADPPFCANVFVENDEAAGELSFCAGGGAWRAVCRCEQRADGSRRLFRQVIEQLVDPGFQGLFTRSQY